MEFLTAKLDNGLEIIAERNAEAHSAAFGFFVRAGSRDESDEIAGVSHFLEHMAFKGTPTRSADDVNREFDEMGANHNACTNEESTIYYAFVLPEYQDWAVDLLGDILRPSLRVEDFNTEKQVILEEIRMYEDQPPFGADEKARAAYFGEHPLGRSVLGTHDSISALPVEAMFGYFRRRYSPANVILAAAGRVDFDALLRAAQRRCGSWELVPSERVSPPVRPQLGFHCLHKASATQQYALQFAAAPAAADADRFAAKVLATILGDESGSRLYWELIDPGLAEQAGLGHCEFEGAGVFTTFLSCDPDQAADNLDRINAVYQAAQASGFSEIELQQAKNKILSRIVLGGETPRGRLFPVAIDWVHRRQYRSVADDLRTIAALTLDDVAAVLSKYPLTACSTMTIGPLAGALLTRVQRG